MSRTQRRALLGTAALVLASGCAGEAASTGADPGRTPAQAVSPSEEGTPFTLKTHCGIRFVRIDGLVWEALDPLDDGRGNPPAGWGNPMQEGRLTFPSSQEATFLSPAGTVTFTPSDRKRMPDCY